MFYTFTGVHPGFLSSLLSRTPTSNPIGFFRENRGKNTSAIHKIYGGILLRELAFEGGAFTRRSRSLAPWYLLPPWMSGKSSPFWFPMSLGITSFEGDTREQQDPCNKKWEKSCWKVGEGWVRWNIGWVKIRWRRVWWIWSTVSQLLLRWNNPEIVLVQTGVRDIVIFNSLLFPSVSIFS